MKKIITIIFLILVCNGCLSSIAAYSNNNRLELNLPVIEPLNLLPIKFYVISENNLNQVFDFLKKQKKEPVLIAITVDDYKNLSQNISELKRFIELQKETIKQYKNYYEPNNNEEPINE